MVSISVSIAPFAYFVEAIAGSDFAVNVMVPPGADPHIYEPLPAQIAALSASAAYISDGYLAFEMNWLEKFYGINPAMMKLVLGDKVSLITSDEKHDHDYEHLEKADPHFWASPKAALEIASSVKSLLCALQPVNCEKYSEKYEALCDSIRYLDRLADSLFSSFRGRSFMIFHPSLGYLARDYGLKQLAVEVEGKEPNPGSMKEFIDMGRKEQIKVILVQAGFDTKNAKAIALETGAEIKLIDPLGENWLKSTREIINIIYGSLTSNSR
jgi:zinc transport system substrate-binding protein